MVGNMTLAIQWDIMSHDQVSSYFVQYDSGYTVGMVSHEQVSSYCGQYDSGYTVGHDDS